MNISGNSDNGFADHIKKFGESRCDVIWPILVVIIVIILIWIEYQAQETYNETREFNATTYREKIDKIVDEVHMNHLFVAWRRSLVISMLAALIVSWILFKGRMPHLILYAAIALTIFVALTFTLSWFNAHWFANIDYKIEDHLSQIRDEIASIKTD
jgi:uncharacterized integral membrane protein